MKKNLTGMVSLALIALLSFSAVARAEDTVKSNDNTKAEEVKHFRIGLRGLYVFPTESFDKRLSGLSLSKNFAPCADLEYFFTNKISTELIAGVTKHAIKSGGDEIGSTYLLPPSLTVKYHPFGDATYSPYIGAGIEMTFPFNDHVNKSVGNSIRIDASIGYALQAGIDVAIDKHLYFNIDYKYLNADTRFKIDNGPWYKLDMNPHVFGVGAGYRF